MQAVCASEKPVQKQLGSPGNINSNYSTGNNFKKGADIPVIKAVRKTPVPHSNPSSINFSNKNKVSTKKEPSAVPQTPSGPTSKSSGSSAKEQL